MSDMPLARSKWRRTLPLIASGLAILIGLMLIAAPTFLASVPRCARARVTVRTAKRPAPGRRADS